MCIPLIQLLYDLEHLLMKKIKTKLYLEHFLMKKNKNKIVLRKIKKSLRIKRK